MASKIFADPSLWQIFATEQAQAALLVYWQCADNAFDGSIYGLSSNARMAPFTRPGNRSKKIQGLYYVGGSTHPGGGVPLVMLSGKIVAELVEEDNA